MDSTDSCEGPGLIAQNLASLVRIDFDFDFARDDVRGPRVGAVFEVAFDVEAHVGGGVEDGVDCCRGYSAEGEK